ncbi:hypothetical protein BIV25_37180 [Streptomyces sp. MUSC 14]|uniref:hypothetical protein n=1 Tax=Streptomyces sp. MUSC 14 TaxID=1354889 RepID=UPI0008F5D90A|nr:hypothetical protein [Streptomyces sp. MUSC 14]OIJ88144.1 hypothetical protein BIV25_37180 [Streptomyces sp. MUSC 14]
MLVEWIADECWRCDAQGVPVTWVGPVQWDGEHAPFRLCEPCLTAIERKALVHLAHRSFEGGPSVTVRDHEPPTTPIILTRSLMEPPERAQYVSIAFTGVGIRAQAHGRTGREAWQMLRHRHPRLMWAVTTAYALVAGSLAVTVVTHLVT